MGSSYRTSSGDRTPHKPQESLRLSLQVIAVDKITMTAIQWNGEDAKECAECLPVHVLSLLLHITGIQSHWLASSPRAPLLVRRSRAPFPAEHLPLQPFPPRTAAPLQLTLSRTRRPLISTSNAQVSFRGRRPCQPEHIGRSMEEGVRRPLETYSHQPSQGGRKAHRTRTFIHGLQQQAFLNTRIRHVRFPSSTTE